MDSFRKLQHLVSTKLTWEVFEEILKKQSGSDSIQLQNITFGPNAKKGDSYLSKVTRFSVEYSGDVRGSSNNFQLYIIAKSLIENIAQRNTFRNSDFFTNEIVFYKDVWPQLAMFQEEVQPLRLFQEIPTYAIYLYGHFDGLHDYILLEDLSSQGYRNDDRANALTFERAKLILTVLARFHALGVAFKDAKPELFETTALKLRETYFHEDFRAWYTKFHRNLCSITLDAVQQELPSYYTNKLQEVLSRDIYGESVQLCSPARRARFKTITHGDTWMPNFLTRFDEDENPLHSIMIDFQLSRYASLAQDVHFFIYACTDAKLRAEHYEDMLQFYCRGFNEFYVQLCPRHKDDEEILSYDDLMNELKANGMFAFCMSIEAIIMAMLDDDEVSDMDQMEGVDAVPIETVWVVKPLISKAKRVKLTQVIQHMIDYKYI